MQKIDRNSPAYLDGKRNFLAGKNGPNTWPEDSPAFEEFEAGWVEAESKSKIKLVKS